MKCTLRLGLALFLLASGTVSAETWRVSSKNFNESYILAEIMAQKLVRAGDEVERRFGLGGTLICYEALKNDEIDVYAEYTGTILRAILQSEDWLPWDDLQDRLARDGLTMLPPFGFNNTYVLAAPAVVVERLGLEAVSDLAMHGELRIAFSHEFLERADGWPGLAAAYGLQNQPLGIEHALAYQALQEGKIDLTDAYSTDAEIERYDLRLLRDDLGFFPEYLAIPLVRLEDRDRLIRSLGALENSLDDAGMRRLNGLVIMDKRSFGEVAAEFLAAQGWDDEGAGATSSAPPSIYSDLQRHILRHLQLTSLAVVLACLFGIPLGTLVHRNQRLSSAVLYLAGLLQTIPSIALLALLIPLLGIGFAPAITALFVYSLLPILRNTVLGLSTVSRSLLEVARGLGLTPWQQVRYLKLPMALPSILAGVRTAAVISIGTATLAAFIGAGGLGEPIVTGLALNDVSLILQGAVPAAAIAVLTELIFEGIEVALVPKHLRHTG